jgi:hypothetical protein
MPAAKQPAGISTEWVNVTPKMAAEILIKHNNDNRNVRKLVMSRYQHDMESGQFPVTHQGLAFASDGTLLDGQHRLMAIRESGKPMWMLITRGLPRDIQQFLDRGARRSPSDFLDGTHSRLRVAAMRMLLAIRLLDGTINPTDLRTAASCITDADIMAAFGGYEDVASDLLELASAANKAARQVALTPGSLLTAAVTYPDMAERVLLQVETGAGLEIGDPILALRNRQRAPQVAEAHAATYTALRIFDAVKRGKVWRKMQVDRAFADIKVPIRID